MNNYSYIIYNNQFHVTVTLRNYVENYQQRFVCTINETKTFILHFHKKRNELYQILIRNFNNFIVLFEDIDVSILVIIYKDCGNAMPGVIIPKELLPSH